MKELKGILIDIRNSYKSNNITYSDSILPDREIPITRGFSSKIEDVVGRAKLYQSEDKTKVYADLKFHDDMDNDLLKRLTPATAGVLKKVENGMVYAETTSVGLGEWTNQDPKVESIGRQLDNRKIELFNKLQEAYDREINFSISCFWDGEFKARIGDEMNGWTKECQAETFQEAAEFIVEMAGQDKE